MIFDRLIVNCRIFENRWENFFISNISLLKQKLAKWSHGPTDGCSRQLSGLTIVMSFKLINHKISKGHKIKSFDQWKGRLRVHPSTLPPLSSFTSQRINRKFHRKPILIIYSYRKSFLLRSIGRAGEARIGPQSTDCCCCIIRLVDGYSDISFLSCLGFSSLTSGRRQKKLTKKVKPDGLAVAQKRTRRKSLTLQS